jgi:hypothetical protein
MKFIQMGRWSQFRKTLVSQVTASARWAEISDMSGDVGFPFDGLLVCESVLRIKKPLLSTWPARWSLRTSLILDCQATW